MSIEQISYSGWDKNLRLSNDQVELIITLDVGPRIISYRSGKGANVFKTYPEQLGADGETEWKVRGGHRFWIAPENSGFTYVPDNESVSFRVLNENSVELQNHARAGNPIAKELTISLDPASSRVALRHLARNEGDAPVTLATWGVSVMAPGGIAIIPLPPPGEHPRDLLPDRTLVLWPYTDMSDPRWRWGENFIILRQESNRKPMKFGLPHRVGWVSYALGGSLFVKTSQFDEKASYPDRGCSFETFTNAEMLEMETLGGLTLLQPGEATSHLEVWHLFDSTEPLSVGSSEAEIAAAMARVLSEMDSALNQRPD